MRPTLLTAVLVSTGFATPSGARSDDPSCVLVDPAFERSTSSAGTCLACHDGSGAPPIAVHASHPADVSYAAAWFRGSPALNPVPPRVLVLPDGNVTCATCHDGSKQNAHRTALPEAQLCTACHLR